VRPETLRAIFMDLGAEFGEQGFRWIFLIHMHGAPDHNQALDDAGEYFRDVYGGRMINLAGLDTGSDPGVEAKKANASKEGSLRRCRWTRWPARDESSHDRAPGPSAIDGRLGAVCYWA
jgi:hypothetical protein